MFKSLTFHVQVGLKSLRLVFIGLCENLTVFFFDVVSKRAPT